MTIDVGHRDAATPERAAAAAPAIARPALPMSDTRLALPTREEAASLVRNATRPA